MDYDDFTVVIPTLNEERNISILINKLIKTYNGINVVVVDDGSKDKTRLVVDSISRTNACVRFYDRSGKKAKGLTISAIEGILRSKTRFSIIMDADLQHPIEPIGTIAEKLMQENKIVVAVRKDARGWQLYRKLISKSLIMFGYASLRLRNRPTCSDIFSGFFGVENRFFKRTYLENKNRFISGGYKILFDLLKCAKRTVRINEVPYSFGLRKYGLSKASFRHGILLFRSFIT